jgi:hypothetical protein
MRCFNPSAPAADKWQCVTSGDFALPKQHYTAESGSEIRCSGAAAPDCRRMPEALEMYKLGTKNGKGNLTINWALPERVFFAIRLVQALSRLAQHLFFWA